MTELELKIAYAAKYWLDAKSDIECYLPPDESDSWPNDSSDLIARERLAELEYLNLLEEYRK